MLVELSIENFAIIDRLLLRLGPGFTVLTGETGAGKSIIVDALQAALGVRTATDVVRHGTRYAAVEAIFELKERTDIEPIQRVLLENGIDWEEALILRREIAVAGRSTARINGRAVPLSVLLSVGNSLVDIHGQSEHLSILRRERQLEVIDRYGDTLLLRSQVGDAVRRLTHAKRRLTDLEGGRREAEQRLDLLRFQVQEIESATLTEGEEEELLTERNRLSNAERLAQLAESAYERLQGEHGAVLDGMVAAGGAIHDLVAVDPGMRELDERIQTVRYEVEDIAQELRRYRDQIESDPDRLEVIEERLDLLSRLRRKYGATIADVLAFGRQARESLGEVENVDERLRDLSEEVERAARETGVLADRLSSARQEAATSLTKAMAVALEGLGLKGTNFIATVHQLSASEGITLPGREGTYGVSATGVDQAAFMVSFNPGEPMRPLDRVASGGEASRFLLALKGVLARADHTPTLIFDEVDVGVGARAGLVVAERLAGLARFHQVLSITHLPQVAAVADQHITVSKAVTGGATGVIARALDPDERVAEIAEMMSGMGTETARRNAAELLEAARRHD